MKETKSKNIISYVLPNSIAAEAGIEVGDVLISINGQPVEDIIAYKFYLADEYLEIEIEKPDGEQWIIEVDKEYDEDLGIDFENPILSHMKSCHNQCIFCFIDQLPPNMRESLYFKDDDSRLSFLHGNYITLTNMKETDIDKIIQYRISPINVSVHTTNGELRKKMLNNRFAGNILDILKRLAENDILMNCQIVLCPDVNDQKELDNTLQDLEKLSLSIESIAVVPVGLTRYRDHLPLIKPFSQAMAQATIQQIQGWQQHFREKLNKSFVHLSDEFYILAQAPFPGYDSYDGFPQLENGVGMVVKLRHDFLKELSQVRVSLKKPRRITVITGVLAEPLMKELCHSLMGAVNNLKIDVICVRNDFFGGHVSVSGLITGGDIVKTLETMPLGDVIIIGENMLKSEEPIFLDDMTIQELENQIKRPVRVSPVDGKALIKTILEL